MTHATGGGGAGRAPELGAGNTAPGSGAVVVAQDVSDALASGRAVVALESSVFAQGLPYPHNREACERMLRTVRAAGALPAVTAVIGGRVRLGVDDEGMRLLLSGENTSKVSARDLPLAAAGGTNGATTVSGSLAIARAAGVRVFATGGIGGVHREAPYDESADLNELARTPMVVVCAGAKAILDLPATFERLESLGVTVVGYRTREAPGFFTRTSGVSLTASVESAGEVVAVYRQARGLALPGALLVLNPPPAGDELASEVVDDAVARALRQARDAGIRGAAATPFLLAAVERATGGASLRANVSLLESNAALAAEIAVVLSSPLA